MNVVLNFCKVFVPLKKFILPPLAVIAISILVLVSLGLISTEYDVSQQKNLMLMMIPMFLIVNFSKSIFPAAPFILTIFALANWSTVIYTLYILIDG